MAGCLRNADIKERRLAFHTQAGIADLLDRHGRGKKNRVSRHTTQQARRQPTRKARRAALGPQAARSVDSSVKAAVGMARVERIALDGRLDLPTHIN